MGRAVTWISARDHGLKVRSELPMGDKRLGHDAENRSLVGDCSEHTRPATPGELGSEEQADTCRFTKNLPTVITR